MDDATAERILERLIQMGLLEERAGDITASKRWGARFQAAAERINQRVMATGVAPEGDPIMLAVAAALIEERGTLTDADFDDAVRILTVYEHERRKAAGPRSMGFGGVRF